LIIKVLGCSNNIIDFSMLYLQKVFISGIPWINLPKEKSIKLIDND